MFEVFTYLAILIASAVGFRIGHWYSDRGWKRITDHYIVVGKKKFILTSVDE